MTPQQVEQLDLAAEVVTQMERVPELGGLAVAHAEQSSRLAERLPTDYFTKADLRTFSETTGFRTTDAQHAHSVGIAWNALMRNKPLLARVLDDTGQPTSNPWDLSNRVHIDDLIALTRQNGLDNNVQTFRRRKPGLAKTHSWNRGTTKFYNAFIDYFTDDRS